MRVRVRMRVSVRVSAHACVRTCVRATWYRFFIKLMPGSIWWADGPLQSICLLLFSVVRASAYVCVCGGGGGGGGGTSLHDN